MAVVFRLIEDKDKCDGCAREIKKCVKKLPGVASAKVEKTDDKNGNIQFALIVNGSFDPKKIVKQVKENINRRIELVSTPKKRIELVSTKKERIELVSDGTNNCKAVKVNVERLEKLEHLASISLQRATLGKKFMKLENEYETLVTQLNIDGPKQNKLAKQKKETHNRNLPNVSIPKISGGAGVGAVQKLEHLANISLQMATLGKQLMKLENEFETLVTQLNTSGPKQNKLERQKQETLNPNLPNVSVPKISGDARVKAVQKKASKKA